MSEASERLVDFTLPCGRIVKCPADWLEILPLFGCLDFCPFGGGKMYDCEDFKREYAMVEWGCRDD